MGSCNRRKRMSSVTNKDKWGFTGKDQSRGSVGGKLLKETATGILAKLT